MQQEHECDQAIAGVHEVLGKCGNCCYFIWVPKVVSFGTVSKTQLLVLYFSSFLPNFYLRVLSKHSIICKSKCSLLCVYLKTEDDVNSHLHFCTAGSDMHCTYALK